MVPTPRVRCRVEIGTCLAEAGELFFMCMGVWACVYDCVPCSCLVAPEARGGIWSTGTGDTDNFKLPYWCWELNLCHLEEKQSLLPLSQFSSLNLVLVRRCESE